MNPTMVEALKAKEPGAFVLRALQELLTKDGLLLRLDANERSIACRLAMYLQLELPQLHIDCEYNRDGIDPKIIQHFYLDPDSEDTEAKTAFPDIYPDIRGSFVCSMTLTVMSYCCLTSSDRSSGTRSRWSVYSIA